MIQAKLIAIMLIIVTLLGSMFALYRYGRHVQFVIDDTKAKAIIYKVTMENDLLKQRLEKDHENSETVINTLLASPAPIVRIPRCNVQTKPATGSIPGEQTGGMVFAATERILEADRQRTQGIIGQAELELNDCRIIKNWSLEQLK